MKKWALLSQAERLKAFYYHHLQCALPLHEVAEALNTTVDILVIFAQENKLPIFEYDVEQPAHCRHAIKKDTLPLTVKRGAQVERLFRPSRQIVFMQIAQIVAQRSTCLSDQNGAVVVLDKRIVATGYNGAPVGKFHCSDIGVCRKELYGFKHFDEAVPGQLGGAYELSRSVHAEQSCIAACAKYGIAINGADIYVTREPCVICLRMIINAGINQVFFLDREDKSLVHFLNPSEVML